MKKLLISIGSISSIVAPVAAVISCSDNKANANILPSTRSNDEIAKDLLTWTKGSMSIFGIVSPTPVTAKLTEDTVKQYWNTPGGEGIRIAAITTAIGQNIWKINMPSDMMIAGIVDGVKLSAQVADDTQLNTYKVVLIQNIENLLKKNNVLSSLQKFDGFLTWLVKPDNKYQNLKDTLLGGKVDNTFLIGVQRNLNSNTIGGPSGGDSEHNIEVVVDNPSITIPVAPTTAP